MILVIADANRALTEIAGLAAELVAFMQLTKLFEKLQAALHQATSRPQCIHALLANKIPDISDIRSILPRLSWHQTHKQPQSCSCMPTPSEPKSLLAGEQ